MKLWIDFSKPKSGQRKTAWGEWGETREVRIRIVCHVVEACSRCKCYSLLVYPILSLSFPPWPFLHFPLLKPGRLKLLKKKKRQFLWSFKHTAQPLAAFKTLYTQSHPWSQGIAIIRAPRLSSQSQTPNHCITVTMALSFPSNNLDSSRW